MCGEANRQIKALALALGLALATTLALAVAPLAGQTAARGLSRADQAAQAPAAIPCGPVISRTVRPDVVVAGGMVDVRVTYDYTCPMTALQVDLVLVVGRGLPGTSFQRLALTRSFREGLQRFVNLIDVSNGSRVGLISYQDDFTVLMPLRGGPAGMDELLQKLGLISMAPIPSINGIANAIVEADRMLTAGNAGPDVTKAILVTYADAPLTPPGPLMTIPQACAQARGNGVTVAAIGMDHSILLANCASQGGHFRSTAADGADLPGHFDQAGAMIFRPKQAVTHDYIDQLYSSRADYEPGSAQPREPDQRAGATLIWTGSPAAKPEGGETIAYRARISADGAPWRGPISIDASLALRYNDGIVATVSAPNPDICVFRPGRPEDCAPVPPTSVPSTMEPTRFKVFLPFTEVASR
jgi:hypothetical protein